MDKNVALAQQYLDFIAQLEFAKALALLSDDAAYQAPNGAVYTKSDTAAAFSMFGALYSGPMQLSIVGTTAEGNRVAVEATVTATLANGQPYQNRYHYAFDIASDQINAVREYCDTQAASAVMAQIAGAPN